jgi:hypothetical protein
MHIFGIRLPSGQNFLGGENLERDRDVCSVPNAIFIPRFLTASRKLERLGRYLTRLQSIASSVLLDFFEH